VKNYSVVVKMRVHDVKICDYTDTDNKFPSVPLDTILTYPGDLWGIKKRSACPYCGAKIKIQKRGTDKFSCKVCGHQYVSPEKRRRAYFPDLKTLVDRLPSSQKRKGGK